jgi:hypothetical protein
MEGDFGEELSSCDVMSDEGWVKQMGIGNWKYWLDGDVMIGDVMSVWMRCWSYTINQSFYDDE